MDLLSSIELPHWLMIGGSYFNNDGLPGSCIYPQQGGCD
jgi:hypothetical protein